VCLTEQPIWAILKSRELLPERYSGYGIAYHKYHLHRVGGRPVLYGSDTELGRRLNEGEPGWEQGKDIFTGGLPAELQYLWVNYDPQSPSIQRPSVDFTWEREWRYKPRVDGLPVILSWDQSFAPKGTIVVERDADIRAVLTCLQSLRNKDFRWEYWGKRVISLEMARRQLARRDNRYAKIDTWPFSEPTN
jgi:hypothetical protein